MFKKLMSIMIVLSIFTVQANAAAPAGLKTAFDELDYALNVQWDQKNKDFYTEQMKKFSNSIRDLQAKGLTNDQLIEFVKTEVKDQKVANDMQTAFNMISINKMSSADASKYMVETMKRSYSRGASWNGDAVVYIALGVLIIAAAVALAAVAPAGTGGTYNGGGGGYYCVDTYVCQPSCYYDYYYGYTCYDDCYWTCY